MSASDATVGDKVDELKTTLAKLVNKLNRDGNHEGARAAQEAIVAVDKVPNHFNSAEWLTSWERWVTE